MTEAANRPVAAVSVAIATCNRPDALARCLRGILSGRVLPAEIVVVDQGDLAAEVVDSHAQEVIQIVHIRQQRLGLSASRNRALEAASADRVAFTDDDCVPDPGWLEAMDRTFNLPNAPDCVTGPLLPLGAARPGSYATASRASTTPREFAGRCLPWDVGTGANFAATRKVLELAGGYDLRLGVGTPARAAEDIELIYRLLSLGARIRYEPAAIMRHERIDRQKRLSNRFGYGAGIGTMSVLVARRGDAYAGTILGRWLLMRILRLCRGAAHGHLATVHEEALVLAGTASGLLQGVRARARS